MPPSPHPRGNFRPLYRNPVAPNRAESPDLRIGRDIPGYQVFEQDAGSDRLAVGDREVYYPLQWFEPAEAFGRPHGFDWGSDSAHRFVLERAAVADATAATPFLQLFSEEDDDGFVMYRRVVDPVTSVLQGFTLALIDLSELFEARVPE